jgi:hypothetical protein
MNNMMNPMAGFIQGSQLASQQANDGLGQQRQRDEQAMRAIQMIGSISLGAKGGNIDGPVDPAKFEQGLDFLQQNGVNVANYRGRPEVADVAARASMTALQQIQGGMAAQQAALQLQATLVGIQQRQQQIGLQATANDRQNRAADIAASRAGIPEGYERAPDGSIRRMAGLPPAGASATPQSSIGKLNADLAAGRITREQFDVEQERITKAAESPLPQNVITSLNSTGKTLTDADRFTRTFEDRFAGYKVNALGEAAMTAGRAGVGTEAMRQGASWWQDYARYRNQVRNELFGSALTAPEARAFEQADIQPGMDPEQIRRNLTRQREAAMSAAKKLVAPHVLAGKSVEQIEAAVGFSLSDMGIERPARRERPQPPSATPAATTPAPAQSQPAASAAAPAATPAAGPRVIGPAPQGAPEGRTGRLPDGTRVRVTNGQLVVVE